MKPFYLAGLLFLLTVGSLHAQVEDRIYQLSGLLVSRSSGEPIPYVRIQVNNTRQGALANGEGFYSLPVTIRDTLYFNHLGYHASKLIVWDYLNEYLGDRSQYVYAINYLLEDTLTLPAVNIFPYDTPEELRTAVANMELLQNSPEDIARQNLDPKTLHTILAALPFDGGDRLMVERQRYYNFYQTKNLIPTVGFDPVTAARMLQYVAEKAKMRKNKDLNYWTE
ncbi:MAG: hypothetical protein SF053_04350 [Bacteroidia bacterium]|nr:hypothetical protein [Bacteroidia bacterium]